MRALGLIPIPIRHVATLPPRSDGSVPAGRCRSTWRGPVVEIREEYRDDAGLLAHELEHARQWWRLPWLGFRLYGVWPWLRLRMEASAYAVQLAHAAPVQQPRRRAQYVDFMARWYRLPYGRDRLAAALANAFARHQWRGEGHDAGGA